MATKTSKTKKSEGKFDFRTIKSFEDACKKVGVDPKNLPDVSMVPEEFRQAIINYYKLCIIYKAINDGWQPDWSNWDQYKYYPWFAVKSSGSGSVLSFLDYFFTYSFTVVGSRLCTNTNLKAEYIGKTFGQEYGQFFLIQQ